jgi:hypothetical protein
MGFREAVIFSTICLVLVTIGTKNLPLGASAFVALLGILTAINFAVQNIIATIEKEK